MQLFAYSWKFSCLQLSFLLTVVFGSFFVSSLSFCAYNSNFLLAVEFLSYNGKVCLKNT